ncbi:MAG: hypothetical protein K6E59_04085 [Bacilli bacterium]|nr:hypothetical protein [Bacilli bacterium]
MAIYRYSETFRSMLYRYKGCGDIELSDCFLERVRLLIRLRYWGYVIVFAPSYLTHIQKRGFDHVPTMLAKLGNPILDIFEKTDDVKQSSQSKNRRKKIGKYLAIKGNPVLKGKKVLFVDDVYTTGSTTKACLRLMRKLRPRKVSVLVLSKVASHGT